MADKVKVYEDLLRKAAGKTGDVRDRVNGVLDNLVNSLDARGEPWGHDTTGNAFAEGESGYKAGRDGLLESGRNAAKTMDSYSDAQTTAADKLRDMDLEGEGNFR
ncbi:hypothetical protein ACWF9G_00760 [Nocardia sp. NPDC055029]